MTVIQPGTSFVYSVLVPSNHPSGVYWFYAPPPRPYPLTSRPSPSLLPASLLAALLSRRFPACAQEFLRPPPPR